ncbi:FadR/GntR family transcriptional regulator [Uliginosibacterium sp. H1]|uniref:FadR/GntR family transcriptional regulator n=1 Tax=Uliginosibacterium sp. H1 TaxID=3114757 RepID=UPI002E194789|nr:FCD domain-containing protein [Uliginosibacterium sp. H1]
MNHREAAATGRQRDSLSSMAARELAARIDGGSLKPGQRLATERELMAEFGVSRTVIREAMSMLRSSGRIATQQGRGAFVLGSPAAMGFDLPEADATSSRDVLYIMDMRLGLETEAAALAAVHRQESDLVALRDTLRNIEQSPTHVPRLDVEFHLAVARATGNPYFVRVLDSITPLMVPRVRVDLFGADVAARRAVLQAVNFEHQQVCRAIERRDAEAARAAMRLHLANSRERLVRLLEFAGETIAA